MSEFLITEYKEQNIKNADLSQMNLTSDEEDLDISDEDLLMDDDSFVITFSEDEPEEIDHEEYHHHHHKHNHPPVEFREIGHGEFEVFEVDQDSLMDQEDSEAMSFKLPGAIDYVDDFEEDVEEQEEQKETDWENDRDAEHFMKYVLSKYPSGIPKHDGKSTLGCERAIMFLTKLNKEISEALRSDESDSLDLATLERIRVNIIKDIVKLKEHVKILNKRHKKKRAEEETDEQIIKEAKSGRFDMVISPFERAITGMIINATVSAGKSFDDVYSSLKEKYAFTPREELSIMQILMDMGQPIFKDRGKIGDSEGKGVDFMDNYFS